MDIEDLKWKDIIQQMEKARFSFENLGRTIDGGMLSYIPPSISKSEDNDLKYINTFDDIKEVIEYINKGHINRRIFKNLSSEELVHGWDQQDFHDFISFEEAIDALKYGTDKYFKSFNYKLKKIDDYIRKYTVLNRISYKNDVVGFVPIVPNAIIGNPLNMINQKKKEKIIPTATIVFEKAVTCMQKSEDMVSFASIIFSLIQILEQKGIRCQVYVSSLFLYDDEIFGYKVKVKNYMQPLNLYKMQFPIISSDMFRRIGFRLLESCLELKNEGWENTYGKTLVNTKGYDLKSNGEPSEKLQELLNIRNSDIFIPSHKYFDFHSSDDISNTIRNIIDKTNFQKYIKLNDEE